MPKPSATQYCIHRTFTTRDTSNCQARKRLCDLFIFFKGDLRQVFCSNARRCPYSITKPLSHCSCVKFECLDDPCSSSTCMASAIQSCSCYYKYCMHTHLHGGFGGARIPFAYRDTMCSMHTQVLVLGWKVLILEMSVYVVLCVKYITEMWIPLVHIYTPSCLVILVFEEFLVAWDAVYDMLYLDMYLQLWYVVERCRCCYITGRVMCKGWSDMGFNISLAGFADGSYKTKCFSVVDQGARSWVDSICQEDLVMALERSFWGHLPPNQAVGQDIRNVLTSTWIQHATTYNAHAKLHTMSGHLINSTEML